MLASGGGAHGDRCWSGIKIRASNSSFPLPWPHLSLRSERLNKTRRLCAWPGLCAELPPARTGDAGCERGRALRAGARRLRVAAGEPRGGGGREGLPRRRRQRCGARGNVHGHRDLPEQGQTRSQRKLRFKLNWGGGGKKKSCNAVGRKGSKLAGVQDRLRRKEESGASPKFWVLWCGPGWRR